MRRSSILLVLVAAALAMTALAGAAPASATVLCKENTTPCSASSIYPKETAIEATATSFKIKNSIATVNCSNSAMTGKTTGEKGVPLSLEISGLTVSKCTTCTSTATAQNLPYKAGLERSEAGNGTLSLESGGKGTPSVKFTNCFGLGINCIYGASPLNLHFEGGNPAKLTASPVTLTRQAGSSEFCPATGTLEATYEITSPKPAYAVVGPGVGETVFCKEGGTVCPSKAATYPSGTTISAESAENGVFIKGLTGGNMGCKGALSLESKTESGKPFLEVAIPSMTFSSCTGACPSLEAEGLPAAGAVEATSGGNGTLQAGLQWKFSKCAAPLYITCIYVTPPYATFNVVGGLAEQAKLEGTFTMNRSAGSNGSCQATITVEAKYNILSPTPLWVGKVEA